MSKAKKAEPPPRIQDLDQADEALRELAELDRIETTAVAKFNAAMQPLRTACEERLHCEIDGERVNFTDRRVALQKDLEAFVVAQRDSIFSDGKKSRELNHGTIGFRLSKPCIEVIEPEEEGEPRVWCGVKQKVLKTMLTALSLLRLGVGKLNGSLVTVKVEPNKTAALQHFKAQEVTGEQLEKIGLRYVAAEDRFFCETKAEQITSHESSDQGKGVPSRAA